MTRKLGYGMRTRDHPDNRDKIGVKREGDTIRNVLYGGGDQILIIEIDWLFTITKSCTWPGGRPASESHRELPL